MLEHKLKEEERIERIIRGLIKLPENKRCINCNSLGPQYVCTTFWTFVCTNCSGVHREFTHRVKSVSMAKFSADEVAALQAGGNEQARKTYFKTWDPQRNAFPDGSNLHRLRNFIRHVYVEGKYTGERNNDKLPLNKAVSLSKGDDYSERQYSEKSKHVARPNLFEHRSFERARRDDFYDPRSLETFCPRNSDRSLRYYIDGSSSPQYRQEKLKSVSRRSRPANFEIVDDRFREDGVRSVRRFESNRCSDAESRARSSSPVSQKGRSKTWPPPVHPVKDISGDNVPPLKLGEPPKANEMKNIECSTQVQKATGSRSQGSTDKKKAKNNTVNTCNLIRFDANPEPPATIAMPQTQQNGPSSDGGNTSAPTSINEKPSNTPNVNSMDFLLFELAGPAVAPSGHTSERPPGVETPSAATGCSLNTEAGITAGSTTNASLDSNVGTINASPFQNATAFPHVSGDSVATVTQPQQSPALKQNQSFAAPTGNASATSLHNSLSLQSLYNQSWSPDPAQTRGPSIHASSKQSSQDVPNLAQDTSSGNESLSSGRKELPAEIFASSHSPFTTAAPHLQFCPSYGMGYGMQYPTTAMGSHDSVKSRNPFDLGDDGLHVQAIVFPSMSSLHGALPSMSASAGPWPQGLPHAAAVPSQGMSYGMMTPPGAYMGQQLPNSMMPSKPQGVNNAGDNTDAFASLDPIQHSSGFNPASAGPNSYPSTRENPFE